MEEVKITFNKRTSVVWSEDKWYNRHFLCTIEYELNCILKFYGYLSFEEILRRLGLRADYAFMKLKKYRNLKYGNLLCTEGYISLGIEEIEGTKSDYILRISFDC